MAGLVHDRHGLFYSGKRKMRPAILAAATLGIAFFAQPGSAATLNWDPGLSDTSGGGGGGTWDLNTTGNWFNGTADRKWTDSSSFGTDTATFGLLGGTVTLNASLSAYGLQFLSSGYTIAPTTSGTLTLGGGGINGSALGAGGIATISDTLSLTSAESWSGGAGTITAGGTVTRNIGATVDFSTTGTFNGAGLLTTVGTAVNGWATMGGSDWAVSNGTSIVGYAASGGTYTEASAATTVAANYAAQNIDIDASTGTIAAVITPTSLRFSHPGAFTVTLATGTNIISSGGILVTSAVSTNLSTITGGTLEGASGKDLVVLQNNTGAGLTISSIIANNSTATGLTKSGAGTLTLNAADTYTGATTVNQGALVLAGNGGTVGTLAGSAITVLSGAELQMGGGDVLGYSNSNALTVYGTLRETIATSETLFRPITLRGGTITANTGSYNTSNGQSYNLFGGTVSTAASSGTSFITLPGTQTFALRLNGSTYGSFNIGASSTLNISAILSNWDTAGDPLLKNGTGTMILSGANTYTGGTTLNAGTLAIDYTAGSNRIAAGHPLTLNGGQLQFLNLGTNTQTFSTTAITNAGNTIVQGTGYTSGVDVDLGTLSATTGSTVDISNLSTTATWIKASGNVNQGILLNGAVTANGGQNLVGTDASGDLVIDATTDYVNNAIVPNSATLNIRAISTGSVGSGPTSSGFIGLSNAGTTDWYSFTNAYTTGTTTIDITNSGANTGNILRLGAAGGIFSEAGGNVVVGATVANGGTLTAGGAANTPGSLSFTSSANTSITVNSVIADNGTGPVSITQAGSGTTYLMTANSYTGGTTVTGGNLVIGNNGNENVGAIGTGAVTLNGGVLWLQPGSSSTVFNFTNSFTLNGGTIRGEDGVQHLATGAGATFAIGASGGTVQATWTSKDVYIDGLISGSGPLTLSHGTTAGQAAIIHITNAANTYSGAITAGGGAGITLSLDNTAALTSASVTLTSPGTLLLNSAGTTTIAGLGGTGSVLPSTTAGAYSFVINDPSATFSYAGTIANSSGSTGVVSLTKNGAGVEDLTTSANTYTGGTTVNAGFLSAGNNGNENAAAFGTGLVTINTGGTLWLQPGSSSSTFSFANSISLNGGTIRGEDGIQRFATGAGATFVVGASGGTIQSTWAAKDVYIDGIISGSAGLTLSHGATAGQATAIHFTNAANTYSGNVTVGGGAGITFDLDSATALQFGSVTTVTAGTLMLTQAAGATIAGLAGTAGNVIPTTTAGTYTLTINDPSSTFTYGGTLANNTGVLALTKTGAGTQIISGTANTYTGTTSITGGTLAVTGSLLSTGTVQVASSATLGGSGSVGNITAGASSAGMVGPGVVAAPGILSASSIDVATNGALALAFRLTALNPTYGTPAASGNDVLHITGATPFVNSVSPANVVNVYLPAISSLAQGQTYTGGVYTDASSFTASTLAGAMSAATFDFFTLNPSGTTTYDGQNYSVFPGSVTESAVASTGLTSTGNVESFTITSTTTPEPASLSLVALCATGLLARRRRR